VYEENYLQDVCRVLDLKNQTLMIMRDNIDSESSSLEGEGEVFIIVENEISEPTSFKEDYFDPNPKRRVL
jgi:hypothetical protein